MKEIYTLNLTFRIRLYFKSLYLKKRITLKIDIRHFALEVEKENNEPIFK